MFALQMILLVLGSAAGGFYIVMLVRGGKYAGMAEQMDKETFSNRDFCGAGFAMHKISLFAMKGKLAKELRTQAKLLYGETYGEFYAQLYHARAISVTAMLAAFVLLAAALVSALWTDMLIPVLLGGGILCAAMWIDQAGEMKKTIGERREACLSEFPNVISKLALLVSSGMTLYQAWSEIAQGRDGPIYELMRRACESVENGTDEGSAYYQFGILSDSQEVRKFSSMLVQSLEKSSAELDGFLMQQSKELWELKRQRMLQKGDEAATKLIIPTTLMLVGILIIILSAVAMSMTGAL